MSFFGFVGPVGLAIEISGAPLVLYLLFLPLPIVGDRQGSNPYASSLHLGDI
ncbi:hypothetical protein CPB86DRAFT_238968 [Serendipita vermifera]|nr:hypothetical protein CPB86DRAFT_238968 [Serendipita vermifera]